MNLRSHLFLFDEGLTADVKHLVGRKIELVSNARARLVGGILTKGLIGVVPQ